jgi:hypothetical protein
MTADRSYRNGKRMKSDLGQGRLMTPIWNSFGAALAFGIAIFVGATDAPAQRNTPRIALKSGESAEVLNVFLIANCRSIAIGSPELEILEGPPELSVTIKEQPIIPRAYNCANPVPGGKVVVTAKDVDERKEAKLTFRVKYKGKAGDRQFSYIYNVSLFPGAPRTGDSGHSTPPTNPAGSGEPASPH